MRNLFAFLSFIPLALNACAEAKPEDCRAIQHASQAFTVCSFKTSDDIRLNLTHPDGAPYAQFGRLAEQVEFDGGSLVFAMNAGMYHADRAPVGLYIEDGVEVAPIVTKAGHGNFGMLPNGVFALSADGGAHVVETSAFVHSGLDIVSATQSGPMLVIDGALHPRFNPDGTSRKRRNGVGISPDGETVHFAISDGFVTFHEFATLFRDVLGTPNALYLDGTVSRLHVPAIDRDEDGLDMGPIVSVVRSPAY